MFTNCHYCSYPSGAQIGCAEVMNIPFSSPVEVQMGVSDSHKQSSCDLTLPSYKEGCVCHKH